MDPLVSNKLRLNSISISRDIGVGSNSKSAKLISERIATKRSAIILSERVGIRLHISNGLRFIPVSVSAERIGQRFGEFSPTRKRPTPPSSKAGPKSTKPAIKKLAVYSDTLWDKKLIQLVFDLVFTVSGLLLDLIYLLVKQINYLLLLLRVVEKHKAE